MPRVKLPR